MKRGSSKYRAPKWMQTGSSFPTTRDYLSWFPQEIVYFPGLIAREWEAIEQALGQA
jgi:hypothetical protein